MDFVLTSLRTITLVHNKVGGREKHDVCLFVTMSATDTFLSLLHSFFHFYLTCSLLLAFISSLVPLTLSLYKNCEITGCRYIHVFPLFSPACLCDELFMHGGQTPKISLWLTIVTRKKGREFGPSASQSIQHLLSAIFVSVYHLTASDPFVNFFVRISCTQPMCSRLFCHLFLLTASCGARLGVPFVACSCRPHHAVPDQVPPCSLSTTLCGPICCLFLLTTSCGAGLGVPFVACSC